MPADVRRAVDRAFGPDAARAHAALADLDRMTKGLVPDRLVRALVVLADGDADALEALIDEAREGSEAVVHRAEHAGGVRVRDLRRPLGREG